MIYCFLIFGYQLKCEEKKKEKKPKTIIIVMISLFSNLILKSPTSLPICTNHVKKINKIVIIIIKKEMNLIKLNNHLLMIYTYTVYEMSKKMYKIQAIKVSMHKHHFFNVFSG